MDVRINEIQSQVHAMDSQALLEPRMLQQIVRACVQAVKADQAREKRSYEERRLEAGIAAEDR